MPKRTFWLVTGAAIGAGSSLWAERKVRQSVQQAAAKLQPDAIVVEVGRSARQAAGTAGDRVRAAVTTGRTTMQRREEELWADLAAQRIGPASSVTTGEPQPRAESARQSAPPSDRRRTRRTTGSHRARRVLTKSASNLDK
jgi:hypothetical protein